jgi:hypothetical protein
MGVVLTLESKEHLKKWAENPNHVKLVTFPTPNLS